MNEYTNHWVEDIVHVCMKWEMNDKPDLHGIPSVMEQDTNIYLLDWEDTE